MTSPRARGDPLPAHSEEQRREIRSGHGGRPTPVFDLLGFGYVSVDDLIFVEKFPAPDSKTPVLRAERHCGGLTGTALVAAARLGCNCAFAGVLGNDDLSAFARAHLIQEGIDLSHSRLQSGSGPVHSVIVVDEMRQTRNIFFDISKAGGVGEDWPEAEAIQSTRVLFADNCGVPGTIRAARLARAARIPVVADFERQAGPRFSELLALADHLILSQAFAQELTGSEDPAVTASRLWDKSRAAVVVTCGAEGCWYLGAGETPRHQPAFKVKTVDTTGCGDVFHGAYGSTLARGLSLPQRIRFASAAAALKAAKPGGQAGIPTRAAVEHFLEEHAS